MGYTRFTSARNRVDIDNVPLVEGQLTIRPLQSDIDEEGNVTTKVQLFGDYAEPDGSIHRVTLATSSSEAAETYVPMVEDLPDEYTRDDLKEKSKGERVVYFKYFKFAAIEQPPSAESTTGYYSALYWNANSSRSYIQAIDSTGKVFFSYYCAGGPWSPWMHEAPIIDSMSDIELDLLRYEDWIIRETKYTITRANFVAADSPDKSDESFWEVTIFKLNGIQQETTITAEAGGLKYINTHTRSKGWTGWIRIDGGVKTHTETELQLDVSREDLRLDAMDIMEDISGDWRCDYIRTVFTEEERPEEELDAEMKCTITKYAGATEDEDIYEANAYYLNQRWVSTWYDDAWTNWTEMTSEGVVIEVQDLDECTYQPSMSSIGYRAYVVANYTKGSVDYEKGWYEIVFDELAGACVWKPTGDGILRFTEYADPEKEYDIMQWCAPSDGIHGLVEYQLYIAEDIEGDLKWIPLTNDTNVPAGALLAWHI